jgi:hypothetical protein
MVNHCLHSLNVLWTSRATTKGEKIMQYQTIVDTAKMEEAFKWYLWLLYKVLAWGPLKMMAGLTTINYHN